MSETEASIFGPAIRIGRPARSAGRARFTAWRAIRLVLATATSWAALVASARLWFYDGFDLIDADLVLPIAVLFVCVTPVLSIWAALEWFGLSSVLRRKSSELAGLLAIVASVATIGVLALSVMFGLQARLLSHAKIAARQMTFTMLADASQVRVSGQIGPGFSRRLRALLDESPARRTVEINSLGGLVDEAMRAARAIEAHPGVAVIVRDECVSACLIVLMSADKRLADYDGFLGVHAAASIADGDDPRTLAGVGAAERSSDRYLLRRGMPADLLSQARRIGPSKIVAVPAADAMDRGILTGLLNDGQPVSADQARLRTGPRRVTVVSNEAS